MGGVAAAYAEVVVLARVPGFIVNESPFHHFALCSNTLSFNSFKPLIRVITAASHDRLERVLRMNGVDINTTTSSGSTALMGRRLERGGAVFIALRGCWRGFTAPTSTPPSEERQLHQILRRR